MDLLKFIVFDILGVTPLLVGFIALIGLLIQRKPIEKVLSGTFKTIVGFLVFAGGAGLAVTSLGNFQTLFSDGFGLKGVMPLAEALTGLAQTKFAMCVSLIMVVGFGWNLFFARITPFKYIFLTGQHNLYLSALLTVTLKALGYSDMTTIIVGSILLGLAACLYPAIAQPWMRKITGNDEIAMGHYVTLAYAASGWIGSKVGDPKQSTEKLNLPGWLGIFKDYIVSVSISVSIFYYIAALAAGSPQPQAVCTGWFTRCINRSPSRHRYTLLSLASGCCCLKLFPLFSVSQRNSSLTLNPRWTALSSFLTRLPPPYWGSFHLLSADLWSWGFLPCWAKRSLFPSLFRTSLSAPRRRYLGTPRGAGKALLPEVLSPEFLSA